MTLEEIRKKIDAIDCRILEELVARAALVHDVGVIKKRDGQEIYAPEREEKLLQRLAQMCEGKLPEKSIRAIYREIMSASLYLENDLKIAYLGPEATWTHQAARSKFGASLEYLPQSTIADVFLEVERGRADYGVVPIENSSEGAVNFTLDVFIETNLKICAQILMKIEHNLLALCERSEIRRVYSHPQALGQCRVWLSQNLPGVEQVEVSSTTRAAILATEEQGAAAIGSKMSVEVYGLKIVEPSIQDHANNTTRFLVIGRRQSPPTGNDKTSIMFSVKDRTGALFSALEPFHAEGLSLTKIESRPSKKKPWEYIFFVDVQGHSQDEAMQRALNQLDTHCIAIKVLGSYPNTDTVVD